MSDLRTIHDAITGEVSTIKLTDAELAERAQLEKDIELRIEAQVAKQDAREALLTKLGITEQEAQLLLGS